MIGQSRVARGSREMRYKLYIRSRLTYAAAAWYSLLSRTNARKLEQQHSVALSRIVDAPRNVRNATIQGGLKIETVD